MSKPFRYPNGKVGDDIPLQVALTSATRAPLSIESARVTIANIRGELLFDEELVSQVEANVAQFIFSPTLASEYIVEWHLQHSGGRDKYLRDLHIRIDPRHAP
jgi:hypothetical protein